MNITDSTPVYLGPKLGTLIGGLANVSLLAPCLDAHRKAAQRATEFCISHFRILLDGTMYVVIVGTRWFPEIDDPGWLSFACLDTEWEAVTGEPLEAKPWPWEN
jgi:hypothetical protein